MDHAEFIRSLMAEMPLAKFADKTGIPIGTLKPVLYGHRRLGRRSITRLLQSLPEHRDDIVFFLLSGHNCNHNGHKSEEDRNGN